LTPRHLKGELSHGRADHRALRRHIGTADHRARHQRDGAPGEAQGPDRRRRQSADAAHVRVHANAVEYVPLGLLLLGLYELDQGWPAVLHAAGIALIVGRLLHIAGMWNSTDVNFGRAAGPTVTWITIAALAVLNLWQIR
jgi:uncharacterized membrane protein YecN with MAPEG domain